METDSYTVNYRKIAENDTDFDQTVMSIDFDTEKEAKDFYNLIVKRAGYGIGYYVELLHYTNNSVEVIDKFEF